jgi:tight adherence protein B
LASFADEVDDRGADKVVIALSLSAQQRAGNLKRVLSTLASDTRDELEMRRKVLSERNGVRRQSTQVAIGILALAGLQAVFMRGWVEPYDSAYGQAVLGVLCSGVRGAAGAAAATGRPRTAPKVPVGRRRAVRGDRQATGRAVALVILDAGRVRGRRAWGCCDYTGLHSPQHRRWSISWHIGSVPVPAPGGAHLEAERRGTDLV